MAVTPKNAGSENDGSTAAPALAKTTFGALAAGDTIIVGLNHTGIATASAPTAPFALLGELVAPTSAESSLHVYVGTSADWSLEASSFTFPISTARGGCLLGWFVAQGAVDMAAVLSAFDRETSATPSIGITPTRDGSYVASFVGAKPAAGTYTGVAGGTGVTWTESIDTAVSATSFLHGQRGPQTTAGPVVAQPTISASASMAQAIVALQPPETVPPTVTGRLPAPGSSAQAVASVVEATFSEAMAPGTLTSSTFTLAPTDSPGSPVAASRAWSAGNTVATLTPSSALAYGTSYTATLTSGLTDVAGNALASAPVTWTFTTDVAPGTPSSPLASGARTDQQRWALEVVDRTGATVGWLDAVSFRITMRMNAPGELTALVLADSPGAKVLEVYSRVVRAWRREFAQPYGARILRFAGHVHQLTEAGDADGYETVELVARDPSAAVLGPRYQPWYSSYTGNLNNAVVQLIGDANISAESPAGLDATYAHGLGVIAVGAGWPAGTWAWPAHQPIADAFRALQEGDTASQGFYWTVKPVSTPNTHGAMWICTTMDGLSPVAVEDRVPQLEYGPGTRRHLTSYRVDRVPPLNSVIAVGKDGLVWKNDSESSGATYGLWGTLQTYSDADTTARLDALARGVWHVFPLDSIAVELAYPPDPDTVYGSDMPPMMWDQFDIGQQVPVYIRGARRTVTGNANVREVTVEVDADGTERVTNLVLDLPAAS